MVVTTQQLEIGLGVYSRFTANHGAFAAILADGSVVTWGNKDFGGDSTAVRDQLRGVQQIHANYGAFAAILADESVISWGHQAFGGDSTAVRDRLKGVKQIQGHTAGIRCDSG